MVKKPIPKTKREAPTIKVRIVPTGMGTRKTLASSTIIVIGRTEEKASIIFPYNILFFMDIYSILIRGVLIYDR
jgi:hypothetical protein